MKNLILSISSIVLLATQLNAQQQHSSTNKTISTTTYYSHTVVDSKNDLSINYNRDLNNVDVQDDTPVASKSFSKSFEINRSDKINLDNKYGSITIKTWDKNEIKVDVDLKAYAKSESEAQKLLDDVSINANKTGGVVSFKTEIDNPRGNWGSNVKNGKTIWRREIKVHYTVYMPSNNALIASQQYGSIIMGNFSGPTSINVQYGNLTAGNLSNANNYISIQYGKGEIKNMGGAKIKHQYGAGLKLGTVNNLELNAQYTNVSIAETNGSTSIKHQYGSGTTIEKANGEIYVSTQYCGIKIDALNGDLASKAQYGKVIIDKIEAGKYVDVDAQYSTVNLGFAANYNADFDVYTNYGNFKYGSNVSAKKLEDNSKRHTSSKSYTGQIGKGGSNTVKVASQYGSINFK